MKPLVSPRVYPIKVAILVLASVSLASAQEVEIRDLCNPVVPIQVAKIEVDKPEPFKIEVDKPEPFKIEADESDGEKVEKAKSKFVPLKIVNDRCVQPSPIGFHYPPKIDARIRRKYEDSLVVAKRATNEAKLSHIILNATIDVTTPPGFFYRQGEFVEGRYDTLDQCMQARRQAGNAGVCGPHEGPIIISLTGGAINRNEFPLGSVSLQCQYHDADDVSKSFDVQFLDVLGMGGFISYQDKIIAQLPPHSVVRDISCKAEAAEIWQPTDNIQTLNGPINP
jgi:hypothetical protein